MLFASNVDVVARAFVTHMIHLKSHSWCIYIPTFPIQLIHLRGQKIYRFVPWIPMRFRQSTPSSWRALWSPKSWWKVREWIPPKCPELLKLRGLQLPGPFKPPWPFCYPQNRWGGHRTHNHPNKKQVTSRIAICIWVFWKPLGFVCQMARISESQVSWKKRVQEKKSCTSWEVVINPIVGVSMGVSENGGTPKSSILIGFSIKKLSILAYHYFWKHPYAHLQKTSYFPGWDDQTPTVGRG